ncbi:MAG: M15 family metallopeptidase, partial [Coriobacteriia bacterium]|nr:M15 family metallopeptidase [Coriobacteriia bacterium]
DDIYLKINGRSYVENPYVSLDDLRYLKLLHYNFDHNIQIGELIVSAELADEFLEIFQELFYEEYEIFSMYLVEDFWKEDTIITDDESCFANNTSAFSYREITYGGSLSMHAFGEAIDINPLQNPYVEYYNGEPWWLDSNADDYIDRSAGLPHMIDYDDACYQAFASRGWTWGGDWWSPKDYQHFEKW